MSARRLPRWRRRGLIKRERARHCIRARGEVTIKAAVIFSFVFGQKYSPLKRWARVYGGGASAVRRREARETLKCRFRRDMAFCH